MKMTGIIFSEMYSDALNSFTQDRNMGAIPFGGRYRLVDFALSNMVNSGILNVGVLVKQHYHSLMDHLSNTQEWDLNRKKGGLQLLPPFTTENAHTGASRGKLDELRNALDYLETISPPPMSCWSTPTWCAISTTAPLWKITSPAAATSPCWPRRRPKPPPSTAPPL